MFVVDTNWYSLACVMLSEYETFLRASRSAPI